MMIRQRGKSNVTTIDGALDMARYGHSVWHISGHGITKIHPRKAFLEITTEPHKIMGRRYTEVIFDEYDR